jgi:hypothetical protein
VEDAKGIVVVPIADQVRTEVDIVVHAGRSFDMDGTWSWLRESVILELSLGIGSFLPSTPFVSVAVSIRQETVGSEGISDLHCKL